MKTFKGGFHVADNKALTMDVATEVMPDVQDYYVSLSQHIGKPSQLVVGVGDEVKQGTLIAQSSAFISANVHSPVCGNVVEVVSHKTAQGATAQFVHICANGNQDTDFLPPLNNDCSAQEIVDRIAQAGIVGMGGAGFPTAVKLQPKDKVDTLVINGAECEPYLNCDNRLLIEHAEQVVQGAKLIAKACGIENVVFGLESNKMQAYASLMAIDGVVGQDCPKQKGDVVVVLLKPKYPQGAEKTLIKACTNRVVPTQQLPSSVGVVVDNVATAYAVYQAVTLGKPLYERVMTVSGLGVARQTNLLVKVGTPVGKIVEFCGGLNEDAVKLISGGPMMGFCQIDTDYYTTKTDSGFLALTEKEANKALPSNCINCGRCAEHCPMRLQPMYIDFYANAGDYDKAVAYGALNCFECGTCAYVCPAKRPLVQSIRLAKQKIKEKK